MRSFLLIVLLFFPKNALSSPILKDGDIVFQTSRSSQSQAIKQATHSIYTHMGIIFFKQNQPFVLEAVQPVKFTPFLKWVARGEQGHVVVKRLKESYSVKTPWMLQKMKAIGNSFIGRNYDLWFQWSDQNLYCSELVYKIYERATGIQIGVLQKAADLSLDHPLVQQKIKERFAKNHKTFQENEPIISPQSMFDDPKLITIFQN